MELLFTILLFAVPVVFSVIAYLFLKPEWVEETGVSWRITVAAAGAFSLVAAGGLLALSDAVDERHLTTVIVAWLAPIVLITDYTAYKIPRGASRLAHWTALAVLVLYTARYGVPAGDYSALMVTGVTLLVPFILMFSRGIGFGDIRLLFLFSVGLSWWVGLLGWAHSLLMACIVGVISFILARALKKGKAVEYTKGRLVNPVLRLFGKQREERKVTRHAVPFGPALILGYLGYAVYFLLTYEGIFPVNSLVLQ